MDEVSTFQSEHVNGLNMHYLKTDKFKTTTIVVNVTTPLHENTVTKNALLSSILKRGSHQYSSMRIIQQKLDELYGALFHSGVFKRGEKQIVQFSIEIANEKYIREKTKLLTEAIHLIGDVLTNPFIENEGFKSDYTRTEKERLSNKIQSVLDDKIQYADFKTIQNMCKNEAYRLLSYGQLDDLEDITEKSLYQYYKEWISTSPIDLFIVGEFDKEVILQEISRSFMLEKRNIQSLSSTMANTEVQEEQLVVERLDVKQGKLNLGLRTYTTIKDDDYIGLILFNGILGGFAHSKLFVNVREKASLAYYAASKLDSHKGIITIHSGIEIENYEKAVQIIKEQLELIKNGQITSEELEQTKAVYSNQLRESIDQQRQLVDFAFHSVLSGRKRTISEILQEVEKATVEDIIKVAKKTKIDTIYFLRDKN